MNEHKNTSSSQETIYDDKKKKSFLPVIILGVVVLVIVAGLQWASKNNPSLNKDESPTVINAADDQQWAYFVGYALGQQAKQLIDVEEPEKLISEVTNGVRDGIADEKPRFTDDEVRTIVEARQEITQEKLLSQAEENQKKGEAYLAEYKKQEGVEKTQSGTLYKKLQTGEGDIVGDKIALVNYVGKHIDGEEFDSSARHGDQPVPFTAQGIIPGLGEALKLMRVGDKWEIIIPVDGGYGKTPPPGSGIKPNEVLVFEIEVVDTKDAPEPTLTVENTGTPQEQN